MRQTWRWFGPADSIPIEALAQIGVEGVVSALHHLRSGEVWTPPEIAKRQDEIARTPDGQPTGLEWEVVESLPVSEAIKTRNDDWQAHIDNYKTSLENLAEAGLETVCYNFMPVLDWTRTDLRWPLARGGTAMRFDLIDFAVFDLFLVERQGAEAEYPAEIREPAAERFREMSEADRNALVNNIVAGLPGANDGWSLGRLKDQLEVYQIIDAGVLRGNMIAFLEAVIPTAQRLGMRLCCHPDDPPFPLLGLPRVMSTTEDYAAIMKAVDAPENGITLCIGSMGVRKGVDFVSFIKEWGSRIHFAHLRNTTRSGASFGDKVSFHEDVHLEGDNDMISIVRALVEEERRRRQQGRSDCTIPMRPDHGQELLDDLNRQSMPGYPLIGRMRGLAELRGAMAALSTRR